MKLSRSVSCCTAGLVVAQMLYLEGQDPEKDINFYINSHWYQTHCKTSVSLCLGPPGAPAR